MTMSKSKTKIQCSFSSTSEMRLNTEGQSDRRHLCSQTAVMRLGWRAEYEALLGWARQGGSLFFPFLRALSCTLCPTWSTGRPGDPHSLQCPITNTEQWLTVSCGGWGPVWFASFQMTSTGLSQWESSMGWVMTEWGKKWRQWLKYYWE